MLHPNNDHWQGGLGVVGVVDTDVIDGLRAELQRQLAELEAAGLDPHSDEYRAQARPILDATAKLVSLERRAAKERREAARRHAARQTRALFGTAVFTLALAGVEIVAGWASRWWLVPLGPLLLVAVLAIGNEDGVPTARTARRWSAALLGAAGLLAAATIAAGWPWWTVAVVVVLGFAGANAWIVAE